jgi:hypothetical protein
MINLGRETCLTICILLLIIRRRGAEPLPVLGHLGSGEPIVKPTIAGRLFFCLELGGVLKKTRFLVVAVVAALVVPTAFHAVLDGRFTRTVDIPPLPYLSESAIPSRPSTSEVQTDNSTATVTSNGAVRGSFTVVSSSGDDHAESASTSTGDAAGDSNSTTVTDSVREANALAVAQNDLSGTAAVVGAKSGRLTMGWVLLAAIWSTVIAGVCTIALLLLKARQRLPSR